MIWWGSKPPFCVTMYKYLWINKFRQNSKRSVARNLVVNEYLLQNPWPHPYYQHFIAFTSDISRAYSLMEKRWIQLSPDCKQQPICFVIEFRNRNFPLINTELHLSQPFSMINCILNMATARKKPKGCWKIILLCNYQYPLRTLSKWINEGKKVLLIKWIHQKNLRAVNCMKTAHQSDRPRSRRRAIPDPCLEWKVVPKNPRDVCSPQGNGNHFIIQLGILPVKQPLF